jgi:tetratricopeptide (TPR) repeat protein
MPRLSPILGIILLGAMVPGARAGDPPWVQPLPNDWAPASAPPAAGGNGLPLQVDTWVAVKPGVKLNDGKTDLNAKTVPIQYRITSIDPKGTTCRYQLLGDVSGWANASDLLSAVEELTAYSKLISKSPCEPELYIVRGGVEIESRKFTQAIADLDEALRLKPVSAIAYYQRARANFLTQPQQLERALGDLYEAIRLDPGNSYMYFGRAQVASRMNLQARATEDYTTVLRLDPTNQQALAALETLTAVDPPNPVTQPVPSPALQLAADQVTIANANAQTTAALAKIEDLRAQIEESRARAEKAMLDAARFRLLRNQTK